MVRRAFSILPLAFVGAALAQSSADAPSLDQLVRQSATVRAAPESVIDQAWLKRAQMAGSDVDPATLQGLQDQGRNLIEEAVSDAARQSGVPRSGDVDEAAMPPARYRLFVSQAMGDAAFKEALALAEQHGDVELVLRGVLPGQTLVQFYERLGALRGGGFKQGDAIPRIAIDPPAFIRSGVVTVPQLERLDDAGERVAFVRGVMEPDWIDRRIADGKHGDLGAWGATVAVGELDMLEQMKAQAQKVDFAALGAGARARFWKHATFLEVPRATEARVREVDPTIVVTEDVFTPDGLVIARKGDRINPLESVGFRQTLVVFDATRPAQVEFVRTFAASRKDEVVTAIATRLDREAGWDGFADLERQIGRPVFLLFDDVRSTFQIERVPTTVVAKGSVFVVVETPVDVVGDPHARNHASKE